MQGRKWCITSATERAAKELGRYGNKSRAKSWQRRRKFCPDAERPSLTRATPHPTQNPPRDERRIVFITAQQRGAPSTPLYGRIASCFLSPS